MREIKRSICVWSPLCRKSAVIASVDCFDHLSFEFGSHLKWNCTQMTMTTLVAAAVAVVVGLVAVVAVDHLLVL